MPWPDFVAAREARRARALHGADALVAGHHTDLPGWRIARPEIVLATLAERPPTPPPEALWAALAEPGDLPDPGDRVVAARLHRRWLRERARGEVAPTRRHRLAWALYELDALAEEVTLRERDAWAAVVHTSSAEEDAASAALWAGWFTGDPWSGRSRWEALYLPAATRSFAAVCAAREVPAAVRERALSDLREGFHYRLLGAGDAPPGWAELAVRVLETAGPVEAVARVLSEAGWTRLATCAAHRGGWADTLAHAWPDRAEPVARARAFVERIRTELPWVETLLDTHVVRRLVLAWASDETPRPWRVATQNRGKARGRLRAVATGEAGPTLLQALLDLDALHARTVDGVRRYAWAWAWQELATDFAYGLSEPVTPPCTAREPELAPFGDEEAAALRTWLLLVVLRGRLGHLRRWVRTGGTGDRDSTWARLLTDALPAALRDDPPPGYRRVRADLADTLDDHLEALRPTLRALADLPEGRGLRAAFTSRLEPGWHAAVPFPRSGFPTLQRHARAEAEDPCT